MRHKIVNAVLASLLLTCLPAIAVALTSDREKPIKIEADSLTIDDSRGVSIYQGRVKYAQGSIQMSADRVTIYSDGGEFRRFEAEGERAHFRQLLDNGQGELRAKARVIDYHAEQQHILLKGNAHVMRGDDEFSGSYIEYDARADIVNARRASGGGERVQVVIQPREKRDPEPVDKAAGQ